MPRGAVGLALDAAATADQPASPEHCLQHPRDPPCLEAPLAWSFRDGKPVHLVVRDAHRGGSALLDFARGALADTREENRRGLEGRTGLREGEALLMRYPEVPGRAADTMRDTPQDLDIGWFSPSGELLEVAPLRARSLALAYSQSSNVAYGLEAPAGTFAARGARPGAAWLDLGSLPARPGAALAHVGHGAEPGPAGSHSALARFM